MIWRLRRLLKWLARQLQRVCPHPLLSFVADAWDGEYTCTFCDKRWFNEVPKLRRQFTHNGQWWTLDGEGGVEKV